jgi:hypothetical protein
VPRGVTPCLIGNISGTLAKPVSGTPGDAYTLSIKHNTFWKNGGYIEPLTNLSVYTHIYIYIYT